MDNSSLQFFLFLLVMLIGGFSWRIFSRKGKRLDGASTPSSSFLKGKPVAWVYLVSLLGMGLLWTRQLPPVLAQGVLASPTPSPQSWPTSTPFPTSEPTQTPPPTETPLVIPATGLVWNPTGDGIYLWQAPGQTILAWLPNGAVIRFLDEWQSYGGLAWARISLAGQEGWVDAPKVLRLALPDTGLTLVTGEGGYLYTEPQGQKITWLSPGTPVQIRADPQSVAQPGWVQVTLPDRQRGWLPQTQVQTIFVQTP